MAENEIVPEDQDSERFNSMLNAAQKQVGAKGGAKPADGKSGASLTQAQIEAMLAGESFDDDNTAAAEKNDPGAAAETQTGRSAGGSEGAEEIQTDNAYLGSIEEAEIDVLEHLFLILLDGLAHSHHRD